MEALSRIGVNPDLKREDLVSSLLLSHSEDQLEAARTQMFEEAKRMELAHPKDILVKRMKRAIGPPLRKKYALDVAELIYVVKNNQPVPRTLLKNGKRSATAFADSRDRRPSTDSPALEPNPSVTPPTAPQQYQDLAKEEYHEGNGSISTLAKEIYSLRSELSHLRTEVLHLRNDRPPNAPIATDVCLLHVRLESQPLATEVGTSMLENLLRCPILNYSIIHHSPVMTLKVKILKHHLHMALTAPDNQQVTVRVWKPKLQGTVGVINNSPSCACPDPKQQNHQLRISTWNCRGLNRGEPYVHQLADNSSDVIVVTEHWLWPFESHRLSQVHPSFASEVKTDARLDENSSLTRGCGGVGLMWRNTLDANPISCISSDRICGIRVKLSSAEPVELTILGVYLPCADLGLETYCEHLAELESLISEGQRLGPVLIAGDFNAHLGPLGGIRGQGSPNQQGVLLKQLLDRCELHAVSLSSLSEGPSYTFWNSEVQTTVDYIIASYEASHFIQHCFTHELSPLNCSDHLPITTVLNTPTTTAAMPHPTMAPKINWERARKMNCLHAYQESVSSVITPLLGRLHDSPEELNDEIKLVSQQLLIAGQKLLPVCKAPKRRRKWYKDQALARLAACKKAAWDRWSNSGRPIEGPLHEEKVKTRAEFRKRMNICAANEERKRVQLFDRRFKQKTSNRFKTSKTCRQGTTLRVDQLVTSDPDTILATWEKYFKDLGKSREEQFPVLSGTKEQLDQILVKSMENEETLLDVPFCSEEIEGALRKLKAGKSAGHDLLQPEHLKYGGEVLKIWIQHVCNAVVEFESVPDSLKLGIVTPIYKGGGKDPLDTNSYRGITLTPVLAKVLESLILGRLQDVLLEKGIPHLNQTGYRRKVSCAEAIFSTMEAVSQFAQQGEKMYMCFFDLHKAFDSVQYPVLLKRLYEAGIDGKTWRLIRDWYNRPRSRVRVGGRLSAEFTLERGVLQGSVLSPVLFLLVMDPLLGELERSSLGPSVYGTYAGAFAHADDIRTVTSSLPSLQQQIHVVQNFAKENALTLNPAKCEVLIVSPSKPVSATPVCTLADQPLLPKESVKCLGYWWSWDLSATKAVDEAIKKARRAFFAYGAMGAFLGDLNPLSGKTIYDTCVVPVLLFGSENWILTDSQLDHLEAFQGEIGRRILKLSKSHSTLATRVALKWPSVAARILTRKLNLLSKVSSEGESIGCRMYSSLAAVDPLSLRLIQECQSLENKLDCRGVTDLVLEADNNSQGLRGIKKLILETDWKACLNEASRHQSTSLAAKIATHTTWPKLWDMALDHGALGTAALQALYRTLTRPSFGQKPCPFCDNQSSELSHFEHFITCHTPFANSEFIVELLVRESSDIFVHAKHFLHPAFP